MAGSREPRRRAAQPREQVLAAAMTAIADGGLEGLTMAGLGRRVGMSGGHILYYFGSKEQLLLETLRWSEAQLGERRGACLRDGTPARERLARFVGLYLPTGPGDPRWTLWLEVWSRSPGNAELRSGQVEIEAAWHRELVALLEEGAAAGEFAAVDARRFAVRLRALLDGFALQVVIGLPGLDREDALGHVEDVVRAELLPAGCR